jgi:NAD(P)-dependent dehydrogenase (short-subunit alcohol dehydrogenase family)
LNRVNSLAKNAAFQLAKTDVRVNAICPGLIETGMTQFTFEYARKRGTASKIGQLNPLGRYAVPEGMGLDHLLVVAES